MTLQVNKEDMWLWTLKSSHDFTVRSAYKILVHQHHTDTAVPTKDLWHKDIPMKVVLFPLMLDCALVAAVRWKLPLIYFYIVIFLGKSDTLFIVGWMSARSSLESLRITSLSLILLVAIALRCDNLFCIWFGMLLCGKYGMKEIAEFSMAKDVRHIRLLIRLNHLLIFGWRWK